MGIIAYALSGRKLDDLALKLFMANNSDDFFFVMSLLVPLNQR